MGTTILNVMQAAIQLLKAPLTLVLLPLYANPLSGTDDRSWYKCVIMVVCDGPAIEVEAEKGIGRGGYQP